MVMVKIELFVVRMEIGIVKDDVKDVKGWVNV